MQGLLDQRQIPYPHGSVLDGRARYVSAAFGHSFFDSRGHVAVLCRLPSHCRADAGPARLQRVRHHRDTCPPDTDRQASSAAAPCSPIRETSSTIWATLIRSRPTGRSCRAWADIISLRGTSISGRTSASRPAASQISTSPMRSRHTPKSWRCATDRLRRPAHRETPRNTETINCDNPLLSTSSDR